MTDPALVARLHRALAAHPVPTCVFYRTTAYDPARGPCCIERLVTETALYEAGPLREWFLAFGRALLEE